MENDLRHELKTGLKDKSPDEILKAIGYSKPDDKSRERLAKILASKALGLDEGSFDLKYSTTEFVIALAVVAGVNRQEAEEKTRTIKDYLTWREKLFESYLIAETDFSEQDRFQRRTLAYFSQKCRINLPRSALELTESGQLEIGRTMAREHYRDTGGRVALGDVMQGNITGYRLVIEKGYGYELSVEGKVIRQYGIREAAATKRVREMGLDDA